MVKKDITICPLKRITPRRYRFSREEAIHICLRKISPKPFTKPVTCFDCYYFDMSCELGETDYNICQRYKNDVSFTNRVRKAILEDYKWCITHFDKFCTTDKLLFIAIYDDNNKSKYEEIL